MHYGFLQGEVAAAGRIAGGPTGAGPSLIGFQFNVVSASFISNGHVAVRLKDGVPADKTVVLASADGGGSTYVAGSPSPSSVVKEFVMTTPAANFYFIILRT